MRRRTSIWENGILLLIGVAAFSLATAANSNGIARKWVTAIFATLIPFGLVTFLRRRSMAWPFWASLAICLGVHLAVVWAFFRFVLASFESFSILLCLPVMLAEIFVLLVAVKRIEGKLTGKKETVRIGF